MDLMSVMHMNCEKCGGCRCGCKTCEPQCTCPKPSVEKLKESFDSIRGVSVKPQWILALDRRTVIAVSAVESFWIDLEGDKKWYIKAVMRNRTVINIAAVDNDEDARTALKDICGPWFCFYDDRNKTSCHPNAFARTGESP